MTQKTTNIKINKTGHCIMQVLQKQKRDKTSYLSARLLAVCHSVLHMLCLPITDQAMHHNVGQSTALTELWWAIVMHYIHSLPTISESNVEVSFCPWNLSVQSFVSSNSALATQAAWGQNVYILNQHERLSWHLRPHDIRNEISYKGKRDCAKGDNGIDALADVEVCKVEH